MAMLERKIIAELHNGKFLEFPEGTPEEAIDQTVAQHHAALAEEEQQQEKARSEEEKKKFEDEQQKKTEHQKNREMHDETMRYRKERDGRSVQEAQRNRKEDLKHRDMAFAESRTYNQRKLESSDQTNRILVGLAQATLQMGEQLQALTAKLDKISDIGAAVKDLRDTVEGAALAIADQLGMPKRIIYDQRNKPIGLERVEENSDSEIVH